MPSSTASCKGHFPHNGPRSQALRQLTKLTKLTQLIQFIPPKLNFFLGRLVDSKLSLGCWQDRSQGLKASAWRLDMTEKMLAAPRVDFQSVAAPAERRTPLSSELLLPRWLGDVFTAFRAQSNVDFSCFLSPDFAFHRGSLSQDPTQRFCYAGLGYLHSACAGVYPRRFTLDSKSEFM
mmetsp:Transcript_32200/g.74264  ORF Transcript_32200/g.74264 Transcript_32200/m.74264 type:complete len:178 (-) Transcript_32200:179-712(-)